MTSSRSRPPSHHPNPQDHRHPPVPLPPQQSVAPSTTNTNNNTSRFPAKLVHFVVFSTRLPGILSSAAAIAAKSPRSGSPSRHSFSAGEDSADFAEIDNNAPTEPNVDEEQIKQKEILYFYPPNPTNTTESFVQVNDQSKYVGLYKGLIEFTRTFKPDGEIETVHSRKHRVVFVEAEKDLWMVLKIRLPGVGRLTKENKRSVEYFDNQVSDASLKSLVNRAYNVFKLWNGPILETMKSHVRHHQPHGPAKLLDRLALFLNSLIPHWSFDGLDILSSMDGLHYMPLPKHTFLQTVSCLRDLTTEFPECSQTMVLWKHFVIYSDFESSNVVKSIYDFMTDMNVVPVIRSRPRNVSSPVFTPTQHSPTIVSSSSSSFTSAFKSLRIQSSSSMASSSYSGFVVPSESKIEEAIYAMENGTDNGHTGHPSKQLFDTNATNSLGGKIYFKVRSQFAEMTPGEGSLRADGQGVDKYVGHWLICYQFQSDLNIVLTIPCLPTIPPPDLGLLGGLRKTLSQRLPDLFKALAEAYEEDVKQMEREEERYISLNGADLSIKTTLNQSRKTGVSGEVMEIVNRVYEECNNINRKKDNGSESKEVVVERGNVMVVGKRHDDGRVSVHVSH